MPEPRSLDHLRQEVRTRFDLWRRDRLQREERGPVSGTADGAGLDLPQIALFCGRFLVVAAALYVLFRILDSISLVTITMTVAVMISALLRPIVEWLVARRIPRWLAASITFIGGVAAIALSAWFVVSQVTASSSEISTQLENANTQILDWLVHGPLQMSEAQITQLSTDLGGWLTQSRDALLSGAYSTATSALNVLSGIILCLFALLFLLLDDGSIWRWFVGLFPANTRERVVGGGEVAWKTLVAYMRSLVLLAFINALTMVAVMMIGHISLYVPLGVLLFLGALVPMIGMLVAGLVLILIAFVMNGPVVALVMGIALFLTVQLEGNLLNPYILGKAVNIHPLAILATVTAGTLAGGIFGAFVAVPLVAVVNNVAIALRTRAAQPNPPLVEKSEIPDLGKDGPTPA